MSAVGRTVIRLGDDSDCPRTAIVLAEIGEGWLQVVWDGDDQPVVEPFDDLMPRGRRPPPGHGVALAIMVNRLRFQCECGWYDSCGEVITFEAVARSVNDHWAAAIEDINGGRALDYANDPPGSV